MHRTARTPHPTATVLDYDSSLFVALELSRSSWLLAVSVPHSDKVSKYRTDAGDGAELLNLLSRLKAEAERRCKKPVKTISIYEAGLDGFWVHRLLTANGAESHVVDAASIAVDRRSRRVKTDRIDAEKLLRTLMSWVRGERQVCSMVRPPSPVEEDERRLTRERGTLVKERIRHVNRIKGLLATQGGFDFEPIHKDRRRRLEELRRWDGQPLPPRLKAELLREMERLELVIAQLKDVEAARDLALQITPSAAEQLAQKPGAKPARIVSPGSQLVRLRGIGPEFVLRDNLGEKGRRSG